MSLTKKLFSAAFTLGTAAAVGYGLKKLEDKVRANINPPEPDEPSEVIGAADSFISLQRGGSYEWTYTVKDKGIIKANSKSDRLSGQSFEFVPLRDGVTEIEFDYKPKGTGASLKTITYTLEVKNGELIRCNAAGDLEMLEKPENKR